MRSAKLLIGLLMLIAGITLIARAEDLPKNWKQTPRDLSPAAAQAESVGCRDCHTKTDAETMHSNSAVVIGCANCHGGDAKVRAEGLKTGSAEYLAAKTAAHVQPKNKELWQTSRNPEGSYAEWLKESIEFVRFVNPGDLRAAPEACGACHAEAVDAVKKSLMTTSAMLWGGAAYNNNILPYKKYVLGESYTRDGEPQALSDPTAGKDFKLDWALAKLVPIPQWEVLQPGDVFRIFERGGKFIKTQFPEIGNPNKLEEPGRPDILSSSRGPGTGNRISVPVINIHKTRLNDPHLSLLGTNDHPGDFRSSGCTACHVIYANDRDPVHSAGYAKFGHEGKTQTKDPTIPRNEEGHPLFHKFTRSIPSSQCMVCHMHQPNVFVNSFYGFTMWDYESDAPAMWPKQQKYPTDEEMWKSLNKNPEEAAVRGSWSDEKFLRGVSEQNSKLKDTQFADYHGHGWNFRAIFKKDRHGDLLDKDGKIVAADDPQKFKKAVHLKDIHLEKGMQCADCHFSRDSHGDGHIYGEVAQQVEISCEDCHGTVKDRATLLTSGPAAPKGGSDLSALRTPWGKRRFVWRGDGLYQRSSMDEKLEWRVKQVRDIVNPLSGDYNAKAARAKKVKMFGSEKLAHGNEKMACFTCHSSWMTSCGGCHLPIQANWKQKSKHYDGKTTRNWASYNPQVVRDDIFQLGLQGPARGGKIYPVRSSSALVLSSTDINRQRIYIQQPPTAASGHSSQAFAPHFPHTVRTKETKQCTDCHVSKANDNNAIMAQLLLHGTNFVNFMGFNAWVGVGEAGIEAVQVTEWDEPQAVIGSYLHRFAYPDYYKAHQEHGMELQHAEEHSADGGPVNTIQLRGEYLFTTAGEGGFRVYDVANIANKGFSERIVTAPVSPLGQDTHVSSKNATSFALPTTMPIAPFREQLPENMETPLAAIYHYAAVVDSEEGLILVNVDTLQDREPRNNFFKREEFKNGHDAWNENNVLTGARHIYLAGANAYIAANQGIVVLSLDKPTEPKVLSIIPLKDARATAVQFRYLFATAADGLHVIDVTALEQAREVSHLALSHATNLYLARTYAYVANGADGLAIVDIEKPEAPKLFEMFNDDGKLNDVHDVKVATTNASLFAYVADGKNGLRVLQLTDPERVPQFYGFSPPVKPKLIAWKKTEGPALAISKGLDRDRAVDETGHQVSVFGRIGSRPLTLEEQRRLYLKPDGSLFTVSD